MNEFNYNVQNNSIFADCIIKSIDRPIIKETILIRDIEKFYKFIENPDLYRNTKKYNL